MASSHAPDLSLLEIEVLVCAARLGSLREVSRQMELLPSQVTKVIQRLERKVDAKLLTRSLQGVRPTPEGLDFLVAAERILEAAPDLMVGRRKHAKSRTSVEVLGVGSISFICAKLIAPRLQRWTDAFPQYRMRLVEFDHTELVAHGLNDAFDLAVHIGPLRWTRAWETRRLGHLSWGLFGRYGHPLGARANQADVLRYPFAAPTGWGGRGFIEGEDWCPIPLKQRIKGSEATTAETAIEIVQASDQLTFVPEILARKAAANRLVQAIQVVEWPIVRQEIFLSFRALGSGFEPILQVSQDRLGRRGQSLIAGRAEQR